MRRQRTRHPKCPPRGYLKRAILRQAGSRRERKKKKGNDILTTAFPPSSSRHERIGMANVPNEARARSNGTGGGGGGGEREWAQGWRARAARRGKRQGVVEEGAACRPRREGKVRAAASVNFEQTRGQRARAHVTLTVSRVASDKADPSCILHPPQPWSMLLRVIAFDVRPGESRVVSDARE